MAFMVTLELAPEMVTAMLDFVEELANAVRSFILKNVYFSEN